MRTVPLAILKQPRMSLYFAMLSGSSTIVLYGGFSYVLVGPLK